MKALFSVLLVVLFASSLFAQQPTLAPPRLVPIQEQFPQQTWAPNVSVDTSGWHSVRPDRQPDIYHYHLHEHRQQLTQPVCPQPAYQPTYVPTYCRPAVPYCQPQPTYQQYYYPNTTIYMPRSIWPWCN